MVTGTCVSHKCSRRGVGLLQPRVAPATLAVLARRKPINSWRAGEFSSSVIQSCVGICGHLCTQSLGPRRNALARILQIRVQSQATAACHAL